MQFQVKDYWSWMQLQVKDFGSECNSKLRTTGLECNSKLRNHSLNHSKNTRIACGLPSWSPSFSLETELWLQRELVTVTTNAAHIIDICKPVQLKGRENVLEVQRFQQCRHDFRCSALKHGYDFTENLLHTVSTDAHVPLYMQAWSVEGQRKLVRSLKISAVALR